MHLLEGNNNILFFFDTGREKRSTFEMYTKKMNTREFIFAFIKLVEYILMQEIVS